MSGCPANCALDIHCYLLSGGEEPIDPAVDPEGAKKQQENWQARSDYYTVPRGNKPLPDYPSTPWNPAAEVPGMPEEPSFTPLGMMRANMPFGIGGGDGRTPLSGGSPRLDNSEELMRRLEGLRMQAMYGYAGIGGNRLG